MTRNRIGDRFAGDDSHLLPEAAEEEARAAAADHYETYGDVADVRQLANGRWIVYRRDGGMILSYW